MELDQALKRVAVVGAAGKMGSGIAQLLCQEMARTEAEKNGAVGSGEYKLTLIDVSDQALIALKKNLRSHLTRYAEKNINLLRGYFAKNPQLVSNEEVIRAFVEGACDILSLQTEMGAAKDSTLVFEAIIEDLPTKSMAFSTMEATRQNEQYYFTNTSSIPISLLNDTSHLHNHIIGFHFYNPPPVQKLVEIIVPMNVKPELKKLADTLAKRLNKTVVYARDIAGFIGNGHFIREALFACKQARELAKMKSLPLHKAIYLIDRVTREYLVRPMGIFQLMDYIGLDVCQNIAKVMSAYLPDREIHDALIDEMVAAKVSGGQFPDGSQKNGFFQYEKHTITGVYSLEEKRYYPLKSDSWAVEVDMLMSQWDHEPISWKGLQNDRERKKKIQEHTKNLFSATALTTSIAKDFVANSRRIAQNLVGDGTAERMEDIDTVLENGFFHLCGIGQLPIPQEAPVKRK